MVLDDAALDTLFRTPARMMAWPRAGNGRDLRKLYDLVKFGPTSANCPPARFLSSAPEGKEKLNRRSEPANIDKPWPRP